MIRASIQGLDAAKQSLVSLQLGLGDLSPLMDWIGRNEAINTVERFHTSKDSEGVKWAELAASTVKSKRRKSGRGDGTKILIDTGDLMDSITYFADATSALIYSTEDDEKVKAAQFGTKDVPQRAIFGLSDNGVEEIEDQTMVWIEGLL